MQVELQDGAEVASRRLNDAKPGRCQAGSLPQQLEHEAHLYATSRKACLGVSTRPYSSRRVSAISTRLATWSAWSPPWYTSSAGKQI